LSFGKKEEQIFLGREISQHRDYSELTAQKIDEEVRSIVTGSYAKTSNLIKDNLEALHQLAAALLEKETLDGKQIEEIMVRVRKTASSPA
jgi:cell division protease FtsH